MFEGKMTLWLACNEAGFLPVDKANNVDWGIDDLTF